MDDQEKIKAAQKEYLRRYRQSNREKLRIYNREYRRRNADKIKENAQTYWLRKASEWGIGVFKPERCDAPSHIVLFTTRSGSAHRHDFTYNQYEFNHPCAQALCEVMSITERMHDDLRLILGVMPYPQDDSVVETLLNSLTALPKHSEADTLKDHAVGN